MFSKCRLSRLVIAFTYLLGTLNGHILAQTAISVTDLDLLAGPLHTSAALTPDGTRFLYQKGTSLCLLAIDGQQQACTDFKRAFDPESVRWSPDGQQIAFSEDFLRSYKASDIWIMNSTTGALRNLTQSSPDGGSVNIAQEYQANILPIWTRDGHHLLFLRYSKGALPALYRMDDGGKEYQAIGPLLDSRHLIRRLEPSPDNTILACEIEAADASTNGIWLTDDRFKNPRQVRKLSPGTTLASVIFSADSRYLAAAEIDSAGKPLLTLISVADGTAIQIGDRKTPIWAATWSPTGTGLAYLVYQKDAPESNGLYLIDRPGDPGRLVLPGDFALPDPQQERMIWATNNILLLTRMPASKLVVVQFGTDNNEK
jgi:dipeptidyl aminopeptidase/acylaminoacyl peptidase